MRSSLRFAGSLSTLATVALIGCSGGQEGAAEADEGSAVREASATPALCAAVRGNGESILTHFASLSRIVEYYGVVEGMAGGSSASITTFAYESIVKNPVVHRCGSSKCSPDDEAARVALALKSVQGYANTVGDSDEADSIKGLVSTVTKLKAEYEAKGIEGLSPGDVTTAAERLKQVLSIPEVRSVVNPEAIAMLEDVPHLAFNVNELKTSITQLGAFSVDDNRLFFRTGVLAWPALATLFGRVGDFYAGYGPTDNPGMAAWFDACATKARDKSWEDTATIGLEDGETCGSRFEKLVTTFRANVRDSQGAYASRIDERVGDPRSPLRKLVSTAVLEGDAATKYEAARARYVRGEFPTGSIPFEPSFADVAFGYWGNDSDLAKVEDKARGASDLKTKKFTSLGNATWREILSASPAEPGLSRFVALPGGRYSAGGWSDLAPVLLLKNLGCQHVVYVTRQGDESKFATRVAKNASMSEADWSELYDLGNEDSSYARSVAAADAVWCTNWDGFSDSQMSAEVLDAYNAPFETRASFSRVSAFRPYDNVTTSAGKPGCTPGLSAGATFPR